MEKLKKLEDYQQIYADIKPTIYGKWSKPIYGILKPFLIRTLISLIIKRKKLNRGPKPKVVTIENFLNAYFEAVDNGSKLEYLEEHYKISRATYYRYLELLISERIIEGYHQALLNGSIPCEFEIVDGSHVRSIDGSEGLDYGYKEHGKKALKITILSGTNKVIYNASVDPDNLQDHLAFEYLTNKYPLESTKKVLGDSGYNGIRFKGVCAGNGYQIISYPRKYKNKEYSHQLNECEKTNLKKYRPRVEHNFANLKRFLAIQVKRTKLLKTFKCYLQLGILIVSIQNGIINKGLVNKIKMSLKRKL